VLDLEGLADIADAEGITLVVDNTLATPYLRRPFEWGADVVVHSATKFIGGEAYHGLHPLEAFEEAAYISRARVSLLRSFGSSIAPQNAYNFLQGLKPDEQALSGITPELVRLSVGIDDILADLAGLCPLPNSSADACPRRRACRDCRRGRGRGRRRRWWSGG
jgi:O-acetylhomoserine/O-acetylserine sulfhydrylase-like pyridoxal-dependent enzyme